MTMPTLSFPEEIGLQGWVRVSVNGELRWEGSNLVTNDGLAYSATLLGGAAWIITPASIAYETVNTIRIGNGGSTDLGVTPTIPVAPEKTDSALIAEVVKAPPLDQNVLIGIATNVVTFTASIFSDDFADGDFPDTDAAGSPAKLFINEAGLFVNRVVSPGADVLFARVTFPSIAFAPTSGTTLSIEWLVGHL